MIRLLILSLWQVCLASPQYFSLNQAQSSLNFSIDHFGWTEVKGSFIPTNGVLVQEQDGNFKEINLEVPISTVNTGIQNRDEALQEENYFNAARFPKISFSTSRIIRNEDEYEIQGTLTIKGVSHNVLIPATIEPRMNGFWLEAFFTLDRYDYGVGSESSFPVGREVRLDIKLLYTP